MKYKGITEPSGLQERWFTIKGKRKSGTYDSPVYTVIDEWNEELADTDKYRLVLMTYKKKKGQGKAWRIPMFSVRWDKHTGEIVNSATVSVIDWSRTWWSASAVSTQWWEGISTFSTCGLSLALDLDGRFKASKSRKLLFGVALYRRRGDVWERCSNVSQVMLFVNKLGGIVTRVLE